MAVGNTGGAGGSWDDDEKKKKSAFARWVDDKSSQMNAVADIPDNAGMGFRTKTSEPKRYPITQEAKNTMTGQLAGMGINATNPIVGGIKKPKQEWDAKAYPSVYANRPAPTLQQEEAEQQIPQSYTDSTPAKLGFNPVNTNTRAIPASNSASKGLGFPSAPRRTMAEQQERAALLRDASTPYKGSQNGQLTANQMQVRAGIVGANDKYKNDQYGAQLGAASQIAQAQMSQDGANQRALLGEANANERLNAQLGFDASKFQQTAAQAQQQNNLEARRLDMQQANDDVTNFAPKQLNALYEKYDTAKTDSEKSEIAKQIQALKGTATDKEYWTSINGGERVVDPSTGATEKLPDILLNRSTGETRAIPKEPIDYATDARAQAIINDTSLSKEERRKQLEALQ